MTERLTGTPVRRVEDPPLLRGEGTFVADLALDDPLAVHYVTSIHAHAEILAIDVAEALAMPGVVDVVTAADVDLGPTPGPGPGLPPETARPALAIDRVRHVGDPVVAVVAETPAQAVDAAEAVVIEYEPLPPVIGIGAALADDSLLFPELGTNIVLTGSGANDDAPDFSDCDVVAEVETVNQRIAPCPIETRVAAAYWTDEGRLVFHRGLPGRAPGAQLVGRLVRARPRRPAGTDGRRWRQLRGQGPPLPRGDPAAVPGPPSRAPGPLGPRSQRRHERSRPLPGPASADPDRGNGRRPDPGHRSRGAG